MRFMKPLAALAVSALTITGAASAATINASTNQITSTYGGALQITFVSKEAAYSTDLRLASTNAFILNNQAVSPGFTTTIAGPAAGQDIAFRFNVLSTGLSFYTGLAGVNVDGVVHALLMQMADGSIKVRFEDIRGGGDLDYNDLVFTVREVPLPGALALMATGLAGFAAARRRRRPA